MLAEIFLRRRSGEFVYPLAPVPRTAVLVPWFQGSPAGGGGTSVRVFPRGWCPRAAEFLPASIAATMDQIVALVCMPPPTLKLTHALIVLERPGWRGIDEPQRDWLWKRFRVPVFEQIIGPQGELVAAECEAHDGLHAEGGEPLLRGEQFDASPCPCGRKTSRIRALQGVALEHRMAAFAR